ncbi:gephyrin-like molybdotransferase Glp [Sphingomonas sp. LaA6.9]|uniref:molybdopterin molybdotransferase MoeA n=1 Tax=Sphingomonas sp. LaA6.9 TaxID=2919914 RepID=UPI001F4F4431|nr:gephyrin-like molybdotransferase Glp [Sphingomonas sp. LaA6.9]MCJ8159519.1 molybdopterin molybdotransferase MoeA [Sphingomonas sp. LaA6.9]
MSLLPVAEAQARLFALAEPVAVETVPLVEAAGRWAAEDVIALRSQPSADLSAMDGYAIRFADLPGPWRVIGESAAGKGFPGSIGAGEAVRIFTGAPLADSADTVLIQEEATRDGIQLTLSVEGPAARGQHVRRAGSDFALDDRLIAAGDRLTPARIGLAAIGGHGALAVRRRLKVALISTGDELVPPGAPITGTQLPSSNAVTLGALLGDLPVDIIEGGIVPDRLDALAAAFDAARHADVIVTTGGASVGDHDLVRPALEAAGATLDFWKIAMKPGKPLMAGRLDAAVTLGLPGNPVSAFATAMLFLRPLIARLGGSSAPLPTVHTATLETTLPETGGRAEFLRGIWASGRVRPAASQDSAALVALASANVLILRPPHAPAAPAGEIVEILPIT